MRAQFAAASLSERDALQIKIEFSSIEHDARRAPAALTPGPGWVPTPPKKQ
jgi:hypothetical protein